MRDPAHAEYCLKQYIPKGSAIYTTVMQVAQSGMSRHIKILRPDDKQVVNISYYVAEALGLPYKEKTGSVFVKGCGMNMCFWVAYELGQKLYGDGYTIEQRNV
jgi:hypothetical protein|tara:strand:+ start:859 stop:1167 length:309 start_codon:yes stop_codon:yes gene_type:complete